MTGRIKGLSTDSASGSIRTENGLSVHFDLGAVLAYDVNGLAVGQLVTFDLESGSGSRAVNVTVQKQHHAVPTVEKRAETIRLRYLGFQQDESIRTYMFERLAAGQETAAFVVTADLALLRKHNVGIQEGPALCLHLLAVELEASGEAGLTPPRRSLTEQDVMAFTASRPAPGTRPHPRRVVRPHAANPSSFSAGQH